jgi:hypothetical protein
MRLPKVVSSGSNSSIGGSNNSNGDCGSGGDVALALELRRLDLVHPNPPPPGGLQTLTVGMPLDPAAWPSLPQLHPLGPFIADLSPLSPMLMELFLRDCAVDQDLSLLIKRLFLPGLMTLKLIGCQVSRDLRPFLRRPKDWKKQEVTFSFS